MSESLPEPRLEELLLARLRALLTSAEGSACLLLRQLEREGSTPPTRGSSDPRYARKVLERMHEVRALLAELEHCAEAPTLERESFSPTAWILAAVQAVRDTLDEGAEVDLGFSVDVAEKNSRIQGDPILLDRALRSLLLEAARSAGPRGRIRVRGRRDTETDYLVTLRVEGGPSDRTPDVESELARARARRIAEAHGGSIEHRVEGEAASEILLRVPARDGEGVLR